MTWNLLNMLLSLERKYRHDPLTPKAGGGGLSRPLRAREERRWVVPPLGAPMEMFIKESLFISSYSSVKSTKSSKISLPSLSPQHFLKKSNILSLLSSCFLSNKTANCVHQSYLSLSFLSPAQLSGSTTPPSSSPST